MDLRELYRRFRAWQQNPFDYTNHSEHLVRCANCGTEFSDNFCPRCGQKAGVGPVNWQTVRQGLMMIWGMDSRSLSYSLLLFGIVDGLLDTVDRGMLPVLCLYHSYGVVVFSV